MMMNKCFISGFICKNEETQIRIDSLELGKKILVFDIDTSNVLKQWKGSQKYQKITCIALKNTMKELKYLLDNNYKGIIIIEGHIAKPNTNNDNMYIIVDNYIKASA